MDCYLYIATVYILSFSCAYAQDCNIKLERHLKVHTSAKAADPEWIVNVKQNTPSVKRYHSAPPNHNPNPVLTLTYMIWITTKILWLLLWPCATFLQNYVKINWAVLA